jgi:AraC-like DNA-binding protein
MQSQLFHTPSLSIPQGPIVCRAQDFAMLRATIDSPQDFSTPRQPYPRGTGLRVDCSEAGRVLGSKIEGEGYSDFVHMSDDLCARVVSARVRVSTGVRCLGEDWLKIEVYTSGRQSLIFEDIGQIDLSARWCHVHLHPEGMVKGDWMARDAAPTGLIVYLRPEFIRERLPDCVDRLPVELRDFARDRKGGFLFQALPVSPALSRAVAEVVATPLLGSLRRLFLESKSIEVASGALHALMRGEQHGVSRAKLLLRPRDIDCLHHARAVLERDYIDPPRIVQLARHVGLNQQKLKCGFKAVFGVTIFECVRALRLDLAADLLQNKGASVTDAALAAGYQYPSNFAIAFKRRYGVAPRQLKGG